MAGLLPQMSLEPAPGYRRFVECRFEALRRDARRLAGDGPHVEELCSDVLTGVALRWRWFEVRRVWLRRADPAGDYLAGALARRVDRWRAEPAEDPGGAPREIEVVVERSDAAMGRWPGSPGPAVERWPDRFVAADPPAVGRAPVVAGPAFGGPADGRRPAGRRVPATSAAVRVAAVRPLPPRPPSAGVEAVIAWLHAYETYEHYRRSALAAAAVLATAVLFKLRYLGVAP